MVPLNPVAVFAFNPGPITGDGNWTWLVPGRVPTLIDAGTGDPRHLAALDEALAGARLVQVLVTHAHGDHASGAPALARRFPEARFLKMPWSERDGRWAVEWTPLRDGDVVPVGDTSLIAVHTPGHAPDHLCLWHAGTRTVFCGDLAMEGGTVWIPPDLQGDMADYLASLQRVLALRPSRMLPAHGPAIEDPQRLLRAYIDHRREREQQVIDALQKGDATPEAIVARVYVGIQPPVVPLARASIEAHLIKLEREGKVRCESGSWRLA